MAAFIHSDEARSAAAKAVRDWLGAEPDTTSALLLVDLFGKLRVVLFSKGNSAIGDVAPLIDGLAHVCGPWWTGDALAASSLDENTRSIFVAALEASRPDEAEARLHIVDRHRSRTAWFSDTAPQPWAAPKDGPPIIVFYSFKGGLGRSTLLAAFAIQRARAGQRVCVVDFDLDSPGIGRLLSADSDGLTAQWGLVDFLLEHQMPDLQFNDYWHRCDRVSAEGEIRVMPAGRLKESAGENATYPDKLGRVDMEESPAAHESGLWKLLNRIRDEMRPDWILLDARTGISEPAGQLLSGFSHLHVLLGTIQEQSWLGLDIVLDRLGKDRILADEPQAEVLLVQAMVPVNEPGQWARKTFAGQSEQAFEDRYYAAADASQDRFWTVDDKQSQDAPHVPWPIEYDPRLASFGDISEVADALCAGSHGSIGAQIVSRFVAEEKL